MEQLSFLEFEILPLELYDKIIIGFSAGKDSLACVLKVTEIAKEKGILDRVEIWHQLVDGDGEPFIDWPVTESYCRAIGELLGIKVRFQYRVGGFKRELYRTNEISQGIKYEDENGDIQFLPTTKGSISTRRKFPAKSSNLNKRWCTAVLKTDVFKKVLNNTPELKGRKTLIITGERREESYSRSSYLEMEPHPCNNGKKTVHWWRPIIAWTEKEIWALIEKHQIMPHPAYYLGFNRSSCLGCIFYSPDHWQTLKNFFPERFYSLEETEKDLGFTIDNELSLSEVAKRGKSFLPKGSEKYVEMALSNNIDSSCLITSCWELPAGANI